MNLNEFAEVAAVADAADTAGASNAASAGGTDHADQERTVSGEPHALEQGRSAFHRFARTRSGLKTRHWQPHLTSGNSSHMLTELAASARHGRGGTDSEACSPSLHTHTKALVKVSLWITGLSTVLQVGGLLH